MSTGWNNEDLVEIVGVTPADASSHVDYGRFHQQIAVEQLFELPQAKPDIDHLVKIHAAAEVTRTKVISTPVGFTAVVSGVVRQKIIYVADSPEQPLHSAQFERPFCSFIPLPEEDKEDDWEKEEGKPEHQDYAKARTVLVDVVVQPTGKRAIHLYAILFLWLE